MDTVFDQSEYLITSMFYSNNNDVNMNEHLRKNTGRGRDRTWNR
ncbi:MAG: hypothetical protein K0R47_226 [Brevibacillus sp.]|nr:hypothetical protein [Brevibacillus sp.]